MKCPRCQAENQPAAKFCQECGAALDQACTGCGARLPAGAKFCPECGRPAMARTTPQRFDSPEQYTPRHLAEKILGSKAAFEGERKQVTVLFADLKGSLELLADRDPEEARSLLEPVLERMIEAVHRYEGTVNQVMGDGIMALFGAPIAQEDHAVRACYAALRMQDSVKRYGQELFSARGLPPVQIRVGLNSGEVVVGGIGSDLRMEYTAVGQTTHLAARMEQLAVPGTIKLTAATLHAAEGFVQVAPLGAVPIKGLAEPIEVFELSGAGAARSRFQAAAQRGLTRFVGRQSELDVLGQALTRAAGGHGEVAAMVGEPGVGKSRLIWEFIHSHRAHGWLVLEAGSVSYGKATAWRPAIDLLRGYFQLEERDDARRIREKVTGRLLTLDRQLEPLVTPVLSLLDVAVEDAQWEGLDPAQRRARILDACKRLLLRESQVRPLVLVFEDLHWIDHETQAFLDTLVESLPTARVLLLVNYRPEYQNPWTRKSYYTQLRIDPLPPQTAEALLEPLLGSDPGLQALKRLLIQRTEGNPLFLEESVRALVETGTLVGTRGAYRLVGSPAAIQVPATVQAILAARIDRLPPEDKNLLQAASVIGKDVAFGLLQAIGAMPETELRGRLTELREGEFLYEASLFPDLEYTFKHALTHEVAYNSVLHERRKALHAQILEAMERLYADRLAEHIERCGHHALQGEAWDKALTYLFQAGEKAFSRSANRAALAAFEQALTAGAQLPQTPEAIERVTDIRLMARFCAVVLGEIERSMGHAREAAKLASRLGDPLRLAWASGAMATTCMIAGEHAEAVVQAQRMAAIATSLKDPGLRMGVGLYLGFAYGWAGRYEEAIEALTQCAAKTGAWLNDEGAKPHAVAKFLYASPRFFHVFSQVWAARFLAELGRFDEALQRGAAALEVANASGLAYDQTVAQLGLGHAYLAGGDLEQAFPLLERCAELVRRADLPMVLAQLGPSLGYAYCLSGRVEAAVSVLEEVNARAEATGIMLAVPLLLAHLADAYSLAGRSAEAVETAGRAIDCSRRFGQRGSEAWALYFSGNVHARREPPDTEQARAAYDAALALATELGMRPLAAQCQLALGQLSARTENRRDARTRLDAASEMFRDMKMQFWLQKAEAVRKAV